MEEAMKKEYREGSFHMSLSERMVIEQGLRARKTFKEIAWEINRDPTTVSKEIKRVVQACDFLDDPVNCYYASECRRTDLCEEADCTSYCKECSVVLCTEKCRRWRPGHCERLLKPPYVCNGCSEAYKCHLRKKYYKAKDAERIYERKKSVSRRGINMTKEELKRLNELVSPLILQHQSLNHIFATHAEEIGVSRATLYKYIAEGILDAKTMDLPRKIRYKKRKKAKNAVPQRDYSYRHGRTYRHFERYIAEHPELEIVEMDTVKGARGKGPCLLTMLFRSSGLMLIFLLSNCSQASVLRQFDKLTDILGLELFQQVFPVILTDNGSEFKDSHGLEFIKDGSQRTHVFYCDPQQTNQKSRLERNHEYIRYIIPKGRKMYWLTDALVQRMMNHINGAIRSSLNNHAPYQIAQLLMKKEALDLLGLEYVSPDKVQLNPALLK